MERALMRCCDVHSASRRVRISAQRTGYSILCRCMYTYRSIITCNLIDCCYSLRQKRAKKSSILFSDKTSAGKTNDKMKQVAKAPFVVGECSLSFSLYFSSALSSAYQSTSVLPIPIHRSLSLSLSFFLFRQHLFFWWACLRKCRIKCIVQQLTLNIALAILVSLDSPRVCLQSQIINVTDIAKEYSK